MHSQNEEFSNTSQMVSIFMQSLFKLQCPKLFDNEKHVLQDIEIFRADKYCKKDEHLILPLL